MNAEQLNKLVYNNRAWCGAIILALVGLLYPLSIVLEVDAWQQALRWIKNEPALVAYQVVLFPLGVGAFLQVCRPGIWSALSLSAKVGTLGFFVLISVVATWLVIDDASRWVLIPPNLKESARALQWERCIRERIEGVPTPSTPESFCNDAGIGDVLPPAIAPGSKRPLTLYEEALREDSLLVSEGNGLDDLIRSGNMASFLKLFLSWLGAMLVVSILCYFFVMAKLRRIFRMDRSDIEALMLSAGLLITWFPLRIYSTWYADFYTLSRFSQYYIFWIVVILALAGIIALAVIRKPDREITYIISIASGALTMFSGVIGVIRPEWFTPIASFFDQVPFIYYFAAMGLIAGLLIVLIFPVTREDSQSIDAV